jgi:hypothetical protein
MYNCSNKPALCGQKDRHQKDAKSDVLTCIQFEAGNADSRATF